METLLLPTKPPYVTFGQGQHKRRLKAPIPGFPSPDPGRETHGHAGYVCYF